MEVNGASDRAMERPSFQGSVGVVGFNARPIACSLKRLGATVFVSDFWGDDDLSSCCDRWVAVLNPRPGQRQRASLEQPVYDALVENFVGNFDPDIRNLVLGSGFDDHPEAVERLEARARLLGNDANGFRRARDRELVRRLAEELGLRMPAERLVTTAEGAMVAGREIGYPCVIRRPTSGGGGGIRVAINEKHLVREFSRRQREDGVRPLLIQEYVSGVDCSATVIGDGRDSVTVSIQGQLIGMPLAGRNCDFVYCGNYWPSPLTEDDIASLSEQMARLCTGLGLIGYNGIDFVVDDQGQAWVLEVNPRVTGTLEMLELASGRSLMAMHLRACEGELPVTGLPLRPVAKIVAYARRTGPVPDLSAFEGTVDRTPAGVVVRRGDPVCTVLGVGKTLGEAYSKVAHTVLRIQREIGQGRRSTDDHAA